MLTGSERMVKMRVNKVEGRCQKSGEEGGWHPYEVEFGGLILVARHRGVWKVGGHPGFEG